MKKTKLFILACLLISATLYSQSFGFPNNNRLEVLGLIMWLTTGIACSAVGLFLILFGHTSLVLREIALNSRKETGDDANKKKEEYNAIPSLAPILKIIGVIIAIAGWVWPILSKI
jgi:hypothetical protein